MMLKMFPAICAVFLLTLMPMKTALACKCASGKTERNLFDQAGYVAHVKITATELRDVNELENVTSDVFDIFNDEPQYIRVSFEQVEIFKGAKFSPNYLKEFPFTNGNCMLGLRPGLEYVIFLAKDSMGFVFNCSGSFGFYGSEEVSSKINKLREWAKERK